MEASKLVELPKAAMLRSFGWSDVGIYLRCTQQSARGTVLEVTVSVTKKYN